MTRCALNSAANVAEKAAVGLFRWAATDHINKGRPTTGAKAGIQFDTMVALGALRVVKS